MRRYQTTIPLLALVAVGLTVGGCRTGSPESPAPQTPRPAATLAERLGLTAQDFPRLDGSTSTIPLDQFLTGEVLGLEMLWVIPTLPRGFGLAERIVAIKPPADGGPVSADVLRAMQMSSGHSTTHNAYVRLIRDQTADLLLEARAPSPDEQALAKKQKVELDIRPVALDAFVFLANQANPVTGLCLDAIRAIYSGKAKDWGQVGGVAGKLTAYQRERNSGSQELMQSLVMKDRKMIEAPTMIASGMAGPFNRLEADRSGLAYSVFYYEQNMAPNRATKLLEVDGVLPSAETISSRTYPLVAEVYLVSRLDLQPDSPAARLRDWLLTPEGQAVVKKSGYIPITE